MRMRECDSPRCEKFPNVGRFKKNGKSGKFHEIGNQCKSNSIYLDFDGYACLRRKNKGGSKSMDPSD
jgi:hypothetical protein